MTNHQQTYKLIRANIYYFILSVGQESGPSISRNLWFKMSHETAVKPLFVAMVSSDGWMDGGRDLLTNSLRRLLKGLRRSAFKFTLVAASRP